MISTMDDFPVHQIADVVRNTATSDRNFYDRYYFNLMCPDEDVFIVFSLGQYPNLATQDCFLLVRHGDDHKVLRASRELGDRADISVGPMRIEVLEGLKRLRLVVEKNEHNITMDVEFNGFHHPFLEPRHYIRKKGRVLFDTMRFAQLGSWKGTLTMGGKTWQITPDKWMGSRDRSWGVRPVGEAEPQGIHAGTPSMEGMWNYFPVMFDDFVLLYIVNETNSGRSIEEGIRVWKDPAREPEWLGSPEHDHSFVSAGPFKAEIKEGVVRFPEAPGGLLELRGTPLPLQTYLTVGTGYGLDPDWRHGMYQGPLKVEYRTWSYKTDADKMWGLIETPAKFTLKGPQGEKKGFGMMEFAFFSHLKKYTGA